MTDMQITPDREVIRSAKRGAPEDRLDCARIARAKRAELIKSRLPRREANMWAQIEADNEMARLTAKRKPDPADLTPLEVDEAFAEAADRAVARHVADGTPLHQSKPGTREYNRELDMQDRLGAR